MSRILITALVSGQGGVAVKTVELAAALRNNGQDVRELYFNERPLHPFLDIRASGASVVAKLTPGVLAGEVSGLAPDVIFAAYSTPMAAALLAPGGPGVPTVAVVHGQGILFTNRPPLVREALSELSGMLLGRMDRIVCVSRTLEDAILGKGVAPENVRTIHNGFFPDRYRYSIHMRSTRPALLFVGSLHPEKRVDLLIKAVDELKGTGATLDICGDGPEATELRRMAEGLPVIFHAHVDDPRTLMESSDLLVLPSDSEGFPSVLMEAAAIGLPVVCSNIPGSRAVLGENARYFEPGNLGALVTAIGETLSDRQGTGARAEGARERVVKMYSWDRVVEKYLRIMDELSERGGPGDG